MGYIVSIIWGLSAGMMIAPAMVAFITNIGIVPRLLTKNKISKHFFAAANAAMLGTIFGSVIVLFNPCIGLDGLFGDIVVAIYGLLIGIFMGCLTAAIVEVMNVFPVFGRRFYIRRSMRIFILAFAIGKLVGALYFWLYPGFIYIE
ncbi:hypothetical protein AN641_06740 [Candidatus Epulonipiscioides gigas]|nr:hypothetical protein AN641_06740 [Epulopiscium sp. SCG-C07WGA-EpuloA2]